MLFRKYLLFILLCSVLILSACGKDEGKVVEVDLTDQDVPASERHASEYVEPELSEDEKFMKEFDLRLTGREVQFNLANSVDKEFFLNGSVELCDYYNYGYTNEKSYFCGKLTPVDGGHADSWYVYFHRSSFDKFYQTLLNGDVNMRMVASIPSESYDRGQGNMAIVKKAKHY